MSISPGNCKTVAKTVGVGGVKSTTKNPPSPMEYGREHKTPANLGTVTSC